jgi:hypothetical protein
MFLGDLGASVNSLDSVQINCGRCYSCGDADTDQFGNPAAAQIQRRIMQLSVPILGQVQLTILQPCCPGLDESSGFAKPETEEQPQYATNNCGGKFKVLGRDCADKSHVLSWHCEHTN